MKKALLALAAVLMAGSALAQGTIKLENNNTIRTDGSTTYRIPIWVDLNRDGVRQYTAGVTSTEIGIGQWAALNGHGTASMGLFTLANQLTPFATAIFRTDNNGDFFATPTSQTVAVPNAAAGTRPELIAKAWVGSSFATSPLQGTWQFQVGRPLGGDPGGGATPILPSGLAGLGNETTSAGLGVVPEPSTIALGVLGIGALLLRRRK